MTDIPYRYNREDTMHIAICDDESFFRKVLSEEINVYAEMIVIVVFS